MTRRDQGLRAAVPFALLVAAMVAGAKEEALPARLSPDQTRLLSDRLLRANSFKVRLQAALILGVAGGPEAEPPLAEALESDPSAPVRGAAAMALGNLGDSRALAALVDGLVDGDSFVRTEAVRSLTRVATQGGPGVVAATADLVELAPEGAKVQGIRILVSLGSHGAEGVVKLLGDPSTKVQGEALAALEKMSSSAVEPALRGALQASNPTLRAAAATLLGDRGDEEAIAPLADLVSDSTEAPEVRAAARAALLRMSPIIDAEAELEILRDSPEAHLRLRALVLLTAKPSAGVVPLCIGALRDPSPLVRAYAVETLGDFGDRSALPALQAMVNRPDNATMAHVLTAAIRRIEGP
jgi:HEAT repeat protein